ncbi:hypothetical protein, unlikely [Trypanosoma brucei gambiense DAL972]|uniref:Uncharacterized protein n=1 Tax=Trypanosoma brucei gambiense (strain MHOM/CI/86/DAL972) TaxID=679716 RepID=D0A072_TRYB9|nr:hypothetical protein, unlikely [Trypanosoma brucei gambiense DAL972]CBH16630.1 hypothetical protein, unlikely [Trypanosoma brucei gambiense DAL972]|eukprot:XP_011778894.1 hypothetical protein, unlikely [Trypanosoma brucei gambiense DAL972]
MTLCIPFFPLFYSFMHRTFFYFFLFLFFSLRYPYFFFLVLSSLLFPSFFLLCFFFQLNPYTYHPVAFHEYFPTYQLLQGKIMFFFFFCFISKRKRKKTNKQKQTKKDATWLSPLTPSPSKARAHVGTFINTN